MNNQQEFPINCHTNETTLASVLSWPTVYRVYLDDRWRGDGHRSGASPTPFAARYLLNQHTAIKHRRAVHRGFLLAWHAGKIEPFREQVILARRHVIDRHMGPKTCLATLLLEADMQRHLDVIKLLETKPGSWTEDQCEQVVGILLTTSRSNSYDCSASVRHEDDEANRRSSSSSADSDASDDADWSVRDGCVFAVLTLASDSVISVLVRLFVNDGQKANLIGRVLADRALTGTADARSVAISGLITCLQALEDGDAVDQATLLDSLVESLAEDHNGSIERWYDDMDVLPGCLAPTYEQYQRLTTTEN